MTVLQRVPWRQILITIGVLCFVTVLVPQIAFAQHPATVATPGEENGLLGVVFNFVLTVFGWILGMFGNFFDYAVSDFVIGFGYKYNHTGLGVAIDSLWGTVRDVFNLTFIFGLVYIGFQMILGSNSSAQRSLGYLIAAALLVNFSLFITKAVVDFSNLAAAEIFKAFSQNTGGIGSAYMDLLGLSSITSYNNFTTGAMWTYIFGMMAIFLVVSFVLAAGAVMLTVRFVVLNIYLVTSPIMFLGWVFPQMMGQSKKYWHDFLGQAFFAPAFVFMLYMSYKILSTYSGVSKLNTSTSMVNLFTGDGGEITSKGLFPFIALTVVFLLASLAVAKQMGATGASSAIAIGQNIRKRGQRALGGATAGMLARAGRTTVGSGAHALTQNKSFKEFQKKHPLLGRSVYNAAAKVADSSLDPRKLFGIGTALGIGEGKKGGFTTRVNENNKRAEGYNKSQGKTSLGDTEEEIAAKRSELQAQGATVAQEERTRRGVHRNNTEVDLQAGNAKLNTQNKPAQEEITKIENEVQMKLVAQNKKEEDAIAELEQLHAKIPGSSRMYTDKEIQKHRDTIAANTEHAAQETAQRTQTYRDTIATNTKAVATEIENLTTAFKRAEARFNEYDGANYEKRVREAGDSAISRYEYQNQLAYIDALKNWQRKETKVVTGAATAVGAIITGLITGGVVPALVAGAVAGGAGAGITLANKHRSSEVLKKLQNEYGKDGQKKKKSDGENAEAARIAAAIREMEKAGEKTPNNDSNKTGGGT